MNLNQIAGKHTTAQCLEVVDNCARYFTPGENERIAILKQQIAALEYYVKIKDKDKGAESLYLYFLSQIEMQLEESNKKYTECKPGNRQVAFAFLSAAITTCLGGKNGI